MYVWQRLNSLFGYVTHIRTHVHTAICNSARDAQAYSPTHTHTRILACKLRNVNKAKRRQVSVNCLHAHMYVHLCMCVCLYSFRLHFRFSRHRRHHRRRCLMSKLLHFATLICIKGLLSPPATRRVDEIDNANRCAKAAKGE